MADIYDYLDWRGDLTFDQVPFNMVDNLVLASLTYFCFRTDDANLTLGQIADKLDSMPTGTYISTVPDIYETTLITKAGRSRRFKDTRLRYYEDRFSRADNIQFAAMHFDMGDRVYIGFRGTDMTMTGWKEDMMMSFTRIPAMEYAVRYLTNTIDPERTYLVGGHSKGGILAVYGCLQLREEEQNCIERIYDNDGPGLSPELRDPEKFARIRSRICKIIPEFCVVGMLYVLQDVELHITKSDAFAIMQHNMSVWQVTRAGVSELAEIDQTAKRLDAIVNEWVEELDISERTEIVTETFRIIEEEGFTSILQIDSPLKLERLLLALSTKLGKKAKKSISRIREVAFREITGKEVSEIFSLDNVRGRLASEKTEPKQIEASENADPDAEKK